MHLAIAGNIMIEDRQHPTSTFVGNTYKFEPHYEGTWKTIPTSANFMKTCEDGASICST
jgi:hypothetical protein